MYIGTVLIAGELTKEMLVSLTHVNEKERSSSRDRARLIREGDSEDPGKSAQIPVSAGPGIENSPR
jgi:hypothetical protein